jgi:hypothetical protein
MPTDPTTIDVERDVTFHPEHRGSSLLVKWRLVPIGWVEPFKRIPRAPRLATAEAKAELRAHYKPLIGKWHCGLMGGGYFDTRDEAARHIIARAIDFSGEKSLLMQAAVRGDAVEVQRLLAEIRASVVIEG